MSCYVARKRARFKSRGKNLNIPWGTVLEKQGGFLFYNGRLICAVSSQCAYDYFSRDDDGFGILRGRLVSAIESRLEKRDAEYQARWNKVWGSPMCWRYRRQDHQDMWIWNFDFYNAPIENLQAIAKLVGVQLGR